MSKPKGPLKRIPWLPTPSCGKGLHDACAMVWMVMKRESRVQPLCGCDCHRLASEAQRGLSFDEKLCVLEDMWDEMGYPPDTATIGSREDPPE